MILNESAISHEEMKLVRLESSYLLLYGILLKIYFLLLNKIT